jgi:tRNA(adenine34) deaminase
MKNKDEIYMLEALKEAEKAYNFGEVPVGCVIVKDDQIIGRGYNVREASQTVFSHAEVIAIEEACKKLNSWRLEDCEIYVTLEPCLMCSGAILSARIKRLVYGAKEPKFGAHQSILNAFDYDFNHKTEVVSGVLEEKSNEILKRFFKKIRSEKN